MGISKEFCGIMNRTTLFSAPPGYWLLVSLFSKWISASCKLGYTVNTRFACSRLVDANYHTGLIVVSGVYYASLLAVLLNIVIVDDTKVDVDG